MATLYCIYTVCCHFFDQPKEGIDSTSESGAISVRDHARKDEAFSVQLEKAALFLFFYKETTAFSLHQAPAFQYNSLKGCKPRGDGQHFETVLSHIFIHTKLFSHCNIAL